MKTIEADLVMRAKETLGRIFEHVPALTVNWDHKNHHVPPDIARLADFTVEIRHDNRVYPIAVAVQAHGFPQQLTQAIAGLLRYRYKIGRNDELMVVAPYITPEGAQLCRDDKVSFFDLAGNCRIAMGPLYLERQGNPNPFQKNVMAAPSLYGMRGERILRILLHEPKKPWTGAQLAAKAGVSTGTASIIRKLLTDRDWVKETPDGILLTQPEKLLRDWAQVWSRRALKPLGYFSRRPLEETEQRLAAFAKDKNHKLALTGTAAAWRYAPMTRYQRTQVYWEGDPQEVALALDLKPTETGANVHFLVPRDRGVFEFLEIIEGVPIVSPVQVYLDLQRDPARGEEAAAHLWKTRLFP